MPALTGQAPRLILGFLDTLLRQGLLLAAPRLIVMPLADVALPLVGRLAPQLRLDDDGRDRGCLTLLSPGLLAVGDVEHVMDTVQRAAPSLQAEIVV